MTTKPKRKLDAYTLRWAASLAETTAADLRIEPTSSWILERAAGLEAVAGELLAKAREIEKESSR